MASERMMQAIGRMEQALARLEGAAAAAESRPAIETSSITRARAADALKSLDSLITELKAGRG